MPTVEQIVAKKIIDGLEGGVIPWRKPWVDGIPRNPVTGITYSGINLMLLSLCPYRNLNFLTRKQILANGGEIKRGEEKKFWLVVFWKQVKVKDKDDEENVKTFPLMRYYKVWNVEQTEGGLEERYPDATTASEHRQDGFEEVASAKDDMVNRLGVQVGVGQSACYIPSYDKIVLPIFERFSTLDGYFATFFHELAHATGNGARLNRDFDDTFGSDAYCLEELVAEFASAFLCAKLGIGTKVITNSTAYIQGWVSKLKNDPKILTQASSRAKKAVKFLETETPTNRAARVRRPLAERLAMINEMINSDTVVTN